MHKNFYIIFSYHRDNHLKNGGESGIFVIEEIDFPEKREDMRTGHSMPDLKTILKKIISNENFETEYINKDEKNYLLSNIESISFFKGNINEVAVIKKK